VTGGLTRVRIVSLAAGGDGVGRLPDGRAVFVPRTAPGDLVEPGPLHEHRNWARAESATMLEPGPDRVAPRCLHYDGDRCGGCQWQHVSAPAQLRARAAIVGEALRRLGGRDTPDPEVEPAPADWGYRHKLTLHADAAGRIGLHPLNRPAESFDLRRCEIAHEDLNRLWRAVDAKREFLPRRLRRLVMRRTRDGALHLVAEVDEREAPWPAAEALREQLLGAGVEAALWVAPGRGWRVGGRGRRGGGASRPATRDSRLVAGKGGADPGAFEQVAPGMGDRIRRFAVESLGELGGRHAWDLYAGIGETSALLAAGGATVESVEAVPAVRRLGGPAARWHDGRVEDLVGLLATPDVVVTNPPRAGMDAGAVAGLAAAGPARIAYVSCDPATLARDLRRLAGYRLAVVRAFDLFPQTAHVETVAVLERR
jgi:23S rRNA (uracil1939-C5)-methyltransferase